MRIGHYQTISKSGDFETNFAKFVEGLKRADRDKVEIVCFPECFLIGCAHSGEHAWQIGIAADSPQMTRALDGSSRFAATAVVGFGELRGGDFYNSAVLHKRHLLRGVQQMLGLR